jgi:hypothetical protein
MCRLCDISGSRSHPHAATTTPPPTPTEPIIKSVQGLLGLSRLECGNGCTPIGRNLCPSFCGKLSVHIMLDAIGPEGIASLHLEPRISLAGYLLHSGST